jgi:hypothetical protein
MLYRIWCSHPWLWRFIYSRVWRRVVLWKSISCLLPASRVFLAWLIPLPGRWRRHAPPKRWLTLYGLHGVTAQKTAIFCVRYTEERFSRNNADKSYRLETEADALKSSTGFKGRCQTLYLYGDIFKSYNYVIVSVRVFERRTFRVSMYSPFPRNLARLQLT